MSLGLSRVRQICIVVIAVILSGFSDLYPSGPNEVLNRWNAIVVKDLLNVGEIEGRVFIGRNYSVSNSHQFGFKLTKNVTSDIVFASGGTVTTNGQANIKVFYGSAAVASAVNNRSWFQFMQSGGALSAPSKWAADNSPIAAITSAAVYWRTLQSNSTAQIPSGQPGPLKLNCSETEPVAVFNLTDVQTFENRYTQQIELKTSSATKTVIINIKSIDGNVDWSSSNMVSQFNQEYWQCRTIWNFYTDNNNGDMGTISMNGNFKGALVAPTATVTTNSNIDGALVCEYLNIQSEVHNPGGGWSGDAPGEEPSNKLTDWTGTISASEAVCQHEAGWINTPGSVTLVPAQTDATLITSWQIVSPNDGSVDNSVHTSSLKINSGTNFIISGYWPGVRPEDKLVKIRFTANVLDADGNQIKSAIAREVWWDESVCPAPLPKQADVHIEKTVDNTAPADGETVTYKIKVTNNGPGDAKGILVSDVLPSGLKYISHNIEQGTYEPSTGLWTVGNLANGASVSLSVLVKVNFDKIYSEVFDLGAAKDFNLFVLQDLIQPSSDTEGRIAAGRDITLESYSVGDKLKSQGQDVLIAGRDLIFKSGRIYNGNAVYGRNSNLPVSTTTCDGTIRQDNPINFSAARAYLESLSLNLSGYKKTGTVKNEYGLLSLSGQDPYLNVFQVSGSDLSAANDFRISVPNGSVALINISGSYVTWSGGHVVKGTGIDNTLYNFYEADSIKISGIDIRGSVLAPRADVTFASGVQNGQMICKSLKGTGQFNLSQFTGNIPVASSITNTASVSGMISVDNNVADNTSSVEIAPKAPLTETVPPGGSFEGQQWKEVSSFTNGEMVYTIVRNAGSIFAGTVGGKIYRSDDSGLSWVRINNDMTAGWIWSLCFKDGVLYASTERGIYRLAEGKWINAGMNDTVDVRALAVQNAKLYAGTWGRGIYVSSDDGATWSAMNEGLVGNDAVQALEFDDAGNLYAGTFNGGLFKCEAGGQSWVNYPVGSNIVWALEYSGGSLYAALYGDGIYSSADGGISWSRFEDVDMPYAYSIVADESGVIYASSWTNGVYCTVNSGASWTPLGMGGSGVSALMVSGSGASGSSLRKSAKLRTAYAGTKEGKIYALTLSPTGVSTDNTVPAEFSLKQNYPNPFNPTTTIEFAVPADGQYSLKVYNMLGQEVAVLINGVVKAGAHSVNFNASKLASGVYLYKLSGTGVGEVKKMMLIK